MIERMKGRDDRMGESKTNAYLMQSVQKAIVVLRAFSKEEPRLSLTELHKKTGMSVASLQRFIATLVHEGFLHKDEKTKQYQLGLALVFLGRQVEEDSSILTAAKPVLQRLNEEIGESVSLNILDGNERRCLFNLDSKYSLSARAYVGDRAPLYAGASAKSLLAFLPDEQITAYLQDVVFEPITNHTIVDMGQLEKQLVEIRTLGYAKSKSERVLGASSVSAPILAGPRQPIASITIVIPEVRYDQYDENYLIALVKNTASQIQYQF